ncbi:MAG: hypothetical protein ABFS12_12725 [Bacteroidota bacterium]
MMIIKKIFYLIIFLVVTFFNSFTQSTESLGLENQLITSMKIGYGTIAVGTNGNGIYWQNLYSLPDSGWENIELNNVNVRSVYPHKSGPLGWAIGIGAAPSETDSEYVYCSYLGGSQN